MENEITQYWQFRRSTQPGEEPIYSFVEISGETTGVEDTLFQLKERFSMSIQYQSRKEFLNEKEKTLKEEDEIKNALNSYWG